MKQTWFKQSLPIAAIFCFRMLGLFLLIPVFSVIASQLNDATPSLIGIALGIYGLSQGMLQIPFGMLSDHFGRKPLILLGLILFAIGSLIGALSHSIYGIIIARVLQGSGAIGSVLIALLADLTSDNQRTKAMAVIGASIGISFSVAMVISPIIVAHAGLAGIFYLTAVLACLGILLLLVVIPSPPTSSTQKNSTISPKKFKEALTNQHLIRLNAGIFIQHLILTATFFAIPMILKQHIAQGHLKQSWHFYLPLMISSFLLMVPFIIYAERKRQVKRVFLLAVSTTVAAQLMLAVNDSNWTAICCTMFLYFIAFNTLEATLPSLISKQAGDQAKGTAMGIYSSCQFLGIFTGGMLSGVLFQYFGFYGVFVSNACFSMVWFTISLKMQPYAYELTHMIPYNVKSRPNHQAILTQLLKLPGVKHATIALETNAIYLHICKATYQEGSGEKLIERIYP